MKKICLILCAIFLFTSVITITACGNQTAKTGYEIQMTLSDDMTVSGNQKVTFVNQTDVALSAIKFNLFANAYRQGSKYPPESYALSSEAFPNGESFGGMSISKVLVNGEESEFIICGEDENILSVPLKAELYPDESVKIEIDFTVRLANVISRTGYNDKTINLGNCYPQVCAISDGSFYECVYYSYGDPFFSECADYKVSVTLNEKYVLASSGELTDRDEDGDCVTYTYEINSARSFALVASEHFKIESGKANGVEINYYYYDDVTPAESLLYAKKSIEYFSSAFGKYPYKTYSVVQTGFMEGGMEYTSLVMISDRLERQSVGEVIVHETAHQWWQVAVGNNEIEYGFLDESLAEYSVVLFFENYQEYGLSREVLISAAEQTYKIYCSVSDKLFGNTDTTMLRSLPEFNGEYEYVNIAYIKGCIMYDYLRQTIGEDDLMRALKKYYSDYCFKVATPDDLVGAFEKTGADTNGFFKSFFEGKVIL